MKVSRQTIVLAIAFVVSFFFLWFMIHQIVNDLSDITLPLRRDEPVEKEPIISMGIQVSIAFIISAGIVAIASIKGFLSKISS